MGSFSIKELDFFPNATQLISIISEKSNSFFLDSADLSHPDSRYSYVGIEPQLILTGKGASWSTLKDWWAKYADNSSDQKFFQSGLVGYLSYDSLDYWFGYFDSVLVLDHQKKSAFVAGIGDLEKRKEEWEIILSSPDLLGGSRYLESMDPWNKSEDDRTMIARPDYSIYESQIKRIKQYLKSGDVYQINLTCEHKTTTQVSVEEIYTKLRSYAAAPFGALLNLGESQILSASPELLVSSDGKRVNTHPIKGTRPYRNNPKYDEKLKLDLVQSPKDQAELLMIVDLARNDLGKICQYGSVYVDSLDRVERYGSVQHQVARVQGRLKATVNPIEVLQSVFPGGSVTGAPKKRAIEIIDEIEIHNRGIYTGALGFIDISGKMMMNLPIRTIIKKQDKVTFCTGGGIVFDSNAKDEYDEMLLKAASMLKSINGEWK